MGGIRGLLGRDRMAEENPANPLGVECRRPTGENEPTPAAGERVVFVAHFVRGYGLPASSFFRAFLNRFRLQPHHLPANAITQLSALVAFCEGYLGLWLTVELWAKYFQLKKPSVPGGRA